MYWSLIIPIHYNYFFNTEIREIVKLNNNIETPTTSKPTSTENFTEVIQPSPKISPTPNFKNSRGDSLNNVLFKVTAYDLSVNSCGKSRSHKYFGITSSGYNLANLTRESAMSIAVDTNIIPMHSQVYVCIVNEEYKHMNGVYTARDTGGAVKGNIIDIFMGDFYNEKAHSSVINFGVQHAYIKILE